MSSNNTDNPNAGNVIAGNAVAGITTAFACSFCGKTEVDGVLIIVGPAVQICSECVGACVVILAEMPQEQKK